jgi:F0F1-type ATP synthase membrane subunit c/vacuolar-type H+-ATPase subunit K
MFSGITQGFISEKAQEYNIGLLISLIFSESLALYGLIIALVILS